MRTTLYLAGALPLVAAQAQADEVNKSYGSPDHTDSDSAFKAGTGAASSGSIDGVQGVIKLLDTLLDQSIAAKKARAAEWDEDREETCNKRQAVLEAEMTNGQNLIDEMEAAKTRAHGKTVDESGIIDDCKSTKMATEVEYKNEKDEYASYKKTKKAEMAESRETAEALRAASKVIKNTQKTGEAALLQGSSMKEQLQAMLGGYKAILYAMSTPDQAKRLQSAMGDDDDLSLVQQPQATKTAYEPKSGDIVQLLNDMADTAEDNNAAQREALTKRTQENDMRTSTFKATIKNAVDDSASAELRLATAEENKGNYAGKQAEAETAYKENKGSYDDNAKWCLAEVADFESDQAASSAEISALKDGLKVLIAEFGGGAERSALEVPGTADFVQVASTDVRGELVQKLRSLGRKLNSFGLMQLAAAAKSDPFGKIKGLISKMITKLVKDQADEASEKEQCDEQKATQKAALKKARSEHATTSSRVGERQNIIAGLTESIAADKTALAELKSYLAEQVEQFNAIKKFCEDRITAVKGNQEALRKANTILSEGPENPSMENIRSLLRDVLEDFAEAQTKTETYLNKRSTEHTAANSTGTTQAAATEARISGQEAAKANHEKDLDTYQGDLEDDSKELSIAKASLAETEKKCSANIMSHAEKQQRRKAEIEGLQGALEILSSIGGDSAEAAFVQKSMKQTFLGYN